MLKCKEDYTEDQKKKWHSMSVFPFTAWVPLGKLFNFPSLSFLNGKHGNTNTSLPGYHESQ